MIRDPGKMKRNAWLNVPLAISAGLRRPGKIGSPAASALVHP
jgi:hypothetical protein